MGQDGNLNTGLELAVGDKDAFEALIEGLAHAEALAAKKNSKLVVIIDEFSDIGEIDDMRTSPNQRP